MLIGRRLPLLLGILGLLFAAGCARPENTSQSISIGAPDAVREIGSQSLNLNHVVINVTGEGIANPIVYNWDACSDCPQQNAVPTTFDLDIPSGEKRYIQVLAVYKNTDGESTDFQYGDTNFDVMNARVIVAVNVSSVATAKVVEGRVSGRYVTSGGNLGETFPTGIVNVKIHPGTKPAMIIERESILAGWFSFFMMKGINLSYEMEDGTVLFGGPVDFTASAMNPANYLAGNVFKTWVPQHRLMRSESSGMQWKSRPPHIKMYGYFGASSLNAGKMVCLDTQGTASGIMQGDSYTARMNMTAAVPDGTTNFHSNLPTAYWTGGTLASASSCGTMGVSDLYRKHLKITQGHIESNHGSEPFYGPFRQMPTSGGAFDIAADPGAESRTITGQLLPGIRTFVDSIRIYKSVSASAQYYSFDRTPCSAIAAGGYFGFVPAGSGSVDSEGKFSVSASVTTQDIMNGVSTAVCPALGEIVWPFGEDIRSDELGRCKGCEAVQADRFMASMPFSTIGEGQCIPIDLQLYSSQAGRAAVNRQSVTLSPTIIASGGTTAIYFERSCTNALASFSIASNQTQKQVYFKVDGTSSSVGTINISASSGSISNSQSIVYNYSRSVGGPPRRLRFGNTSPQIYQQNQCADVELWNTADGKPANWSGFDSIGLLSVPAGAVSFHSNCSTAMATMGSTTLSGFSIPSSYYNTLAVRSENSEAYDIGVRVVAADGTNLVSSHGMVVRNPLTYTPSFWFRAEPESVRITNGTFVSNWFSRVGSHILAGCSAGSTCPSNASTSFGTLGQINYLRQNDGTNIMSLGTVGTAGTQSSTTMVLVKLATGIATGGIVEHISSTAPYPYFRLNWTGTHVVLSQGTASVPVSETEEALSVGASRWVFLAVRREVSVNNSNIFSMTVNTTQLGSTLTEPTNRNWDQLILGGTTTSFGGGVAELIVVDRALSNDQIQEAYKYLKFKYPFLGL